MQGPPRRRLLSPLRCRELRSLSWKTDEARTNDPLHRDLLFYDLAFNYHVEHHLHPEVPSCHLAALSAKIRETHHDAGTLSNGILPTLRGRLLEAPSRHR